MAAGGTCTLIDVWVGSMNMGIGDVLVDDDGIGIFITLSFVFYLITLALPFPFALPFAFPFATIALD